MSQKIVIELTLPQRVTLHGVVPSLELLYICHHACTKSFYKETKLVGYLNTNYQAINIKITFCRVFLRLRNPIFIN